jgi:hypothetical protein
MSKSPRKLQTGRESHPLPSSLNPEFLPAMLKGEKKTTHKVLDIGEKWTETRQVKARKLSHAKPAARSW